MTGYSSPIFVLIVPYVLSLQLSFPVSTKLFWWRISHILQKTFSWIELLCAVPTPILFGQSIMVLVQFNDSSLDICIIASRTWLPFPVFILVFILTQFLCSSFVQIELMEPSPPLILPHISCLFCIPTNSSQNRMCTNSLGLFSGMFSQSQNSQLLRR